MSLDGFRERRVMAGCNAGLAEEIREKRVHSLKAVGVTGIIAQEDVMLQKENVVLPAVAENQPVLTTLVIRSEFFAEQGAAGICNDGVFHVGNNLRHLLSHAADYGPSRRLQFRQACFDDAGLLAALGFLASLAHPLLA